MRLKNKVALVTGAAGQLGSQFCRTLAREGAEVWVSDLTVKGCERVRRIMDAPGKHHTLVLNVAEPASVKSGFGRIGKESKRLDILINNAGIQVFEPFEKRDFGDFMEVLKVNTGGVFLCIQAAAALMRAKKTKGSIINIGSIYGIVSGDPRIYTDCSRNTSECYGASKAAVIQMTKYFAVHLADDGIRVNCISPGGIFNKQGKDFVQNYSSCTPLSRMANETELNGAVVFLACEDSDYITGHNLVIDGGRTIW